MTPETMPGAEFLQPDKLFDHHRQQLSAMMDGALAPDQARFLLRRLQHDTDLTACWERWQLCGDVLRGHADALLPRDFAQRVATAIAAEAVLATPATAIGRPRWLRWGGGAALAASVAVAALLVLRQTPHAGQEAASDPSRVVVAAPSMDPTDAAMPSTATPTATEQTAATLATAVTVAEVPRSTTPRRSRGQGQRPALRNAARAGEIAAAEATGADPFAIDTAAPGRPWPRAILPEAVASGGFTVGLGGSAAAPSFYPFEPRVPVEDAPAEASPDAIADDPAPR